MDAGMQTMSMSLPARRTSGGTSVFYTSPPQPYPEVPQRIDSPSPTHDQSKVSFPTKNTPRSKKRRFEIISSPSPSSAAASLLVAWNEASINTSPSDVQPLHYEATISPTPSPTPKKLHQYSSYEVAKVLALFDAELLRRIAPEELQNGAWMKKDKKHKLSPNVLAMVHASNDLAMLVPSEILAEGTAQARARVISSFIKIASKCYRLHNYNSLKAILAGLQCTPIFRLKKTWKEVPSKRRKKFDKLSAIMSEEHNWRTYQEELLERLMQNKPCIPFLGVLLSNIAQQDSSNALTESGHKIRRRDSLRKASGVQDYVLLEAITVRKRLEKLRRNSWRHSTIHSEQISSARERALAKKNMFLQTQTSYPSHTMPKQDSCSSIGHYRLRTNAWSVAQETCKDIKPQSENQDKEVCLLSDEHGSMNSEVNCDHSTLTRSGGILDRNFSSSSDSDDSPLVIRKALNRSKPSSFSTTGLRAYSDSGMEHEVKFRSSSSLVKVDENPTKVVSEPSPVSEKTSEKQHQNGDLDLDRSTTSMNKTSKKNKKHPYGGFPTTDKSIELLKAHEKISLSAIDLVEFAEETTCATKEGKSRKSKHNPLVKLLSHSENNDSSDSNSSSPRVLPRQLLPRVSISHIDLDIGGLSDSIFGEIDRDRPSDNNMSLELLSPLRNMIMPSRSLEGLCNSLEIEDENVETFKFDKKSISMQSLISFSSTSSATVSDSCSSSEPSTTSLLSPLTLSSSTTTCVSVSSFVSEPHGDSSSVNESTSLSPLSSPTRISTSHNDYDQTPPSAKDTHTRSPSHQDEKDDKFAVCPISDDSRLTQQRCSVELEGPLFLRPRRGGSTVEQLAQTASPKLANPTDLLSKYQFLSLGCCSGLEGRVELRELLEDCSHNSEAQNYKLSYEREP